MKIFLIEKRYQLQCNFGIGDCSLFSLVFLCFCLLEFVGFFLFVCRNLLVGSSLFGGFPSEE